MKPKRYLAPTNVRVCKQTRARLIKLAKRHGVTPSDLVRSAIAEKLPEWESKGITLARIP
jgi:predicted DNA-binding protein